MFDEEWDNNLKVPPPNSKYLLTTKEKRITLHEETWKIPA